MMRAWDRLLLALGGLLFMAGAAVFAVWLFHPEAMETFFSQLAALRRTVGGYWGLWTVPALLFLFGGRIVWVAFRRPPRVSGVFQVNELGTLTITRESIENLVQQALAQIRGIVVQSLRIKTNEAGEIQITLTLNADGEQDFPNLVEAVQSKVKERVERITGIPVRAIHVEIAKVQHHPASPVAKPRVE